MKSFWVLSTAILMGSAVPVLAAVSTPTVDDKLQAACYDDVNRLCKDAMPDEDKVATCMKQHKAEVSEKCTTAYKASGRKD